MDKKIAPSLMCLDLSYIKESLEIMESEKVEYLHIDIMDGFFVPNLMLGTEFVKQIRKLTNIPLDIHLMIQNPENKLKWFDLQERERVIIHMESTSQINRTIKVVKESGALPVIALNPETNISVLEYILDEIEGILIMTVNPGYAGQSLIPKMLNKIDKTRKFLDSQGYPDLTIEIDGNVSYEYAEKMSDLGGDIFVAGTSSIFSKNDSLRKGIRRLRSAIEPSAL